MSSPAPPRRRLVTHAASAAWAVAFVGCIVGANWTVLHLGTDHGPSAPRTIAVGFGLAAPSGVLLAGAQFTLRDVLHERLGATRTFAVIAASAPLSALLASPALAAASITTFLFAETCDLLLYSRLRRSGYIVAVLGSNLISTVLDSVLFLALAFGATQAAVVTVGMAVGKLEASVLTLLAIGAAARLAALAVHPAPAASALP
ncbi:VUT family protein [Mycobacteroides abscessus]